MASDVHAIAVMPDRAGNSANALRRFKNDGADVGPALQLKGSSQAGRAGSDNDSGLHGVEFS
jgi:hypothetical protein